MAYYKLTLSYLVILVGNVVQLRRISRVAVDKVVDANFEARIRGRVVVVLVVHLALLRAGVVDARHLTHSEHVRLGGDVLRQHDGADNDQGDNGTGEEKTENRDQIRQPEPVVYGAPPTATVRRLVRIGHRLNAAV